MGNSSILGRSIVTVGGGTGVPIVLRGLVDYPVRLSSICTTFDNGGSTGRIRREFGNALPQGDIRRCMHALARDAPVRDLLEHRLNGDGEGITGHTVGNILLLAAEQKYGVMDGIRVMSRILELRGDVIPVSTDTTHLMGKLSDGEILEGEDRLDTRPIEDDRTLTQVWLKDRAFVCREAADAIERADLIVIGPGDLYTSLIPNLLVEGMAEAFARSKGRLVYIVDLMTKWAETRGFSAYDFVDQLFQYGIGRDALDAVLLNRAHIPDGVLAAYREKERSLPVAADEGTLERLRPRCCRVVSGDFLSGEALKHGLVRHDSAKLGRLIMGVLGD